MKRTKIKVLYAVWIALGLGTWMLGGLDKSMLLNYAFWAVMGGLLLWMNRQGINRLEKIADDLQRMAEALLDERAKGTDGNEAYLSAMKKMHFTDLEIEADWMRLQEDWKATDGMDCEVDDYICESKLLELCNYNVCAQVSGVLTALGILGTFLGLVLGLRSFDFSNADQMTSSVEALVGGLNVAFYTSIYGVTLSIIYNVLFRKATTRLTQGLNHFYDVFHSVMTPVSQKAMAERLDSRQSENNALMQDIRELLDERLGQRLGNQMAETLVPVFDRITQSLDTMMLDFHKEQADSLEKIVDAFVDRMGVALNSHVNALGESVDQLSQTQRTMSDELQNLIGQIVKTGKDTARINAKAREILEQLGSYVPLLEQTSRDSAGIIENMVKWSADIQTMTDTQSQVMNKMAVEQNDVLKTMAEHEENLEKTCREMQQNQQQLSESLVQFVKAAEVLSERERDPMQFDDIKEMLSAYISSMQQIQHANAENIESIQNDALKALVASVSEQSEKRDKENQQTQQMMVEEIQKMAKTQDDLAYLNAKIANTLSGSGAVKIQLPSKRTQQDEEKWSQALNEKMDAWIREQKVFQEKLLQLEEERRQPFWSRWGRR